MSRLRVFLATLINIAAADPGKTKMRPLPGGTTVHLTIDDARRRHFSIWRNDAAPNRKEWNTFLSHWPEALPYPTPDPSTDRNARYGYGLSATWPKPGTGEIAPAALAEDAAPVIETQTTLF